MVAPPVHNHEVPVPPFSVHVTAGSAAHFDAAPEILAVEGLMVMVTTVDESTDVLVPQATASLK